MVQMVLGRLQMIRSDREFRFRRSIPLITLQFRYQTVGSDWFVEPDGSDGLQRAKQKPEKPKESYKSNEKN